MKILHVLKSLPDEITETLLEGLSEGHEDERFEMFRREVDYDRLIEVVFESDKVVCWW